MFSMTGILISKGKFKHRDTDTECEEAELEVMCPPIQGCVQAMLQISGNHQKLGERQEVLSLNFQ